jgi:anti-sigma factor RsiW
MLAAGMDHRYIDEHSVAERYVAKTLSPEDRSQFEAHLVDCSECTDRVLLAEMFHHEQQDEPLPLRAQLAGRVKPWQLALLFAITVLVLLAIPALVIPLYLRLFH